MSGRYSTGRPDESRGPDYRAPDSEEESLSSSSDYDEEDEDELNSSVSYSLQQQHALYDRRADVDDMTRHGFAEAYSSEEYIQALEQNYFLYWTETRHEGGGLPKLPSTNPGDMKIDWRNRDRVRTAAAVLVVCLRIGYDPPDVIKTDPCAKLECWVDPYALAKDKAMERIGKNLQHQFESLAATPKTRYKQYLDPPVEEAKKFCTAARKTAKNERVLFYYNGHGVPKPTSSGELWLFNKAYTQYIPVSLAEVVAWLGSPTIMVWDCSAAGNIVTKVQEFGIKRDADLAREAENPTPTPFVPSSGLPGTETPPVDPRPQIPSVPFRETIQLGACLGHETLPMNPDLPADLFTCCLTSPIEIGLRFFLLRNPLKTNLDIDMLLKIPGKLNDRRTPLGELTWIFTAVTDTIAWNTLPRELFQKLFRHDLVVAALFRGFLLAERIMRFYECTPISVPALPQTHNHPLWDSWDLAVDMCLAQLPSLLEHERKWLESLPPQPPALPDQPPIPPPPGPPLPYVHSTFFAEQLRAFEIWLEQGAVAKRRHPEQLPVVLQVLLSQAHRLKALILLCKFLDLGPWAVNVALSIGIFAYVLRLLQAPAAELKPVLIYIWSRILAVYENCKEDLLKQTYPATRVDQAPYTYFVTVLAPSPPNQIPLPNVSEHRAMCAFILSICCRDFKPGQVACLRSNVFDSCMVNIRDEDAHLRRWSVLCIAQMWDDFEEAKGVGVRAGAHALLTDILHNDPVPEVRAAVMYALGTFLGTSGSSSPLKRFGRSVACCGPASGLSPAHQVDVELGIAMATLKCSADGSPLVRRELVVLLSSVVNEHRGQFIVAAYQAIIDRVARAKVSESGDSSELPSSIAASIKVAADSEEGPTNPAFLAAMFGCMYRTLFDLSADSFPGIAAQAGAVMDYILELLFASPLGPAARVALHSSPAPLLKSRNTPPPEPATVVRSQMEIDLRLNNGQVSPAAGPKRTASLATAMKNLAQLTTGAPVESLPPPSSLRLNGRGSSTTNSPSGSASPGLHPSPSTESLRYLQARTGKLPPKVAKGPPTSPTDPAAIEAIIVSLIAADEERLRKRRALPTVSGEGTPDQLLPLKGSSFDFELQYFRESQMKSQSDEADEPGSVLHNERVWRRSRNEGIIIRTQPMKGRACVSRWDEQIGFHTNDAVPNRILFHQFENQLIAADDKGYLTVYDWEKNQRVNRFSNGSTPGVPITSLKFINEDDIALLLTGSADGNVRLFKRYESPDDVQLVSAFQGITEQLPTTSTTQDAGLVMEWQQGRGQLLMGGNVKYIRIWDAAHETMVMDLPTRANSSLTALTCDQVAGNILVAGFGDGGLRVFDRRIDSRESIVRNYQGSHPGWVLNVHMQRGGNRELVSGSMGGEFCVWDIRLQNPIKIVQAHQGGGGMTQLAIHEHAPLVATSSAFNVVKVWDLNQPDEPISKFRNSFGFMNQKMAPMTAMAFHPHHMVLGCSSSDAGINTFQMENYPKALADMTFSQSALGQAAIMEEIRRTQGSQRQIY